MGKRIIYSVIVIIAIIGVTFVIISLGRGYRFDIGKKILTSTGILAVSSYPQGASIYIDGKLTSATNISINIAPAWYDIKIIKEGYIPWQKKVVVKGEIVTKVDVLLLPQNPSLRPLTSSGVLSPLLSPTNSELAYIVPFDSSASAAIQKGGIMLWNLKEGQLIPIGNGPRLLARSTGSLDFTNATLLFSPDEKQMLALFFKDKQISAQNFISAYILDTSLTDQTPIAATSSLSTILSDWKDMDVEKNKTILASLPPLLTTFLSDKTDNLEFSVDENKIMYEATASATLPQIINPPLIGTDSTPENRNFIPGETYIYDIKEDKNFKVSHPASPQSPLPSEASAKEGLSPSEDIVNRINRNKSTVQWYPDSKHIVMLENGTIYITEYDGLNKTTVYAGPLEDSYVFPWPGGGRILILTNYNKAASLFPNLYAVDIR